MPRLLVTDDGGKRILLDEHVQRVHLQDEHSSFQVIERLAWAVDDAERGAAAGRVRSGLRRPRRAVRVPAA
jgi:hypothetical protein